MRRPLLFLAMITVGTPVLAADIVRNKGFVLRAEPTVTACSHEELELLSPEMLAMNPRRRMQAERGLAACLAYREALHRNLKDIDGSVTGYIGQMSARLARLRQAEAAGSVISKY